MKRRIGLILLSLLLLLSSISLAAGDSYIDVKIDGKNIKVPEVSLIKDGKALKTDRPGFIYNNRTLVPARLITEAYGGEIKWDQKTKTASVKINGKTIDLTIDSEYARVNGKEVKFDKGSTPKLVGFGAGWESTMVPLAFISEQIGYEAKYDMDTRTVYIYESTMEGPPERVDVRVDGKDFNLSGVRIFKDGKLLETDRPGFVYYNRTLVPIRLITEAYGGEIKWDQKTKTATAKINGKTIELTIDNEYARVNGKEVKFDKGSTPKLVGFGTGWESTMVPLAFISEQLGYNARWDGKNMNIYLEKRDGEVETPAYNSVNNIGLSKDGNSIAIQLESIPNFKSFKLAEPNRLVIDIFDTELKTNPGLLDMKVGVVDKIRFSQFIDSAKEKVVRVVLDIEAGALNSNMDIKNIGNEIIITPAKSKGQALKLGQSSIEIPTLEETPYSVDYSNKKMLVKIPKNKVNLNLGKNSYSNNFVEETNVYSKGSDILVEIIFRRDVSYSLASKNPSKNIKIDFKSKDTTKPNNKTVMIDPGHGGHDPGAVAAGYYEKHIALATSLKLRNELEARGYKVIMTRQEDQEFYTVNERWQMANKISPDVFLSVHVNSASTNKAKGIETLHAYKPENPNKGQKQLDFANAIQSEVIKSSGAVNRGLKDGGWVGVLKYTKMTSALIELGFMPNVEERTKLLTDHYQEKLAVGIANGIDKYFEKY